VTAGPAQTLEFMEKVFRGSELAIRDKEELYFVRLLLLLHGESAAQEFGEVVSGLARHFVMAVLGGESG